MTSGYSRGTDPPHPAGASRLRLGLNTSLDSGPKVAWKTQRVLERRNSTCSWCCGRRPRRRLRHRRTSGTLSTTIRSVVGREAGKVGVMALCDARTILCSTCARGGAERSCTRVPTVGAHLDALHEDETFDPRGDRRLHDERVLAVVIAAIIPIVVVLRLCLCVPVGTAPPSSHPSVLPLRSLVRYNSRQGSRSDRKRR